MRQSSFAAAVVIALLVLRASAAHAGGLEYQGQGAAALGRAGAVTAKATDPMVIADNPAGLAELRGSQFMVDLNLALMHACYEPAGYYGWGLYLGGQSSVLRDRATGESRTLDLNDKMNPDEPYYTTPLDTVCLDQNVVPVPQIAWSTRLTEKLGIGAGLIFPAVSPGGHWGGPNGIIHGRDGLLYPSPARYMLLSSNNLGLFPNIAAGYRIAKWLRLGAALEWGIIAVNTQTMAGVQGGTIPADDIVARIKAQDWFVPAFTVSAHLVPIDALDVVFSFHYQDDVRTHGKASLMTGEFSPGGQPYNNENIKIYSLRQHMPWKLRAGIRYADRLAPRPVGTGADEADPSNAYVIHDALQDERWDVELDLGYELNGRNQSQVLDWCEFQPPRPGATVPVCTTATQQKLVFKAADPMGSVPMVDGPAQTVIEKHWKNQLTASLGGTLNLLPGVVGVSAGVNYETRGIDPSYMQIDFFPVSRVGLSGGVIFRVAKSIDLVASYGHIFQETIIAAPPPHQDRTVISDCQAGNTMDRSQCLAPVGQVGAIDKSTGPFLVRGEVPPPLEAASQGTPDATAKLQQSVSTNPPGQPPYVVNSGRYSSHFDVIAVGVHAHF